LPILRTEQVGTASYKGVEDPNPDQLLRIFPKIEPGRRPLSHPFDAGCRRSTYWLLTGDRDNWRRGDR